MDTTQLHGVDLISSVLAKLGWHGSSVSVTEITHNRQQSRYQMDPTEMSGTWRRTVCAVECTEADIAWSVGFLVACHRMLAGNSILVSAMLGKEGWHLLSR